MENKYMGVVNFALLFILCVFIFFNYQNSKVQLLPKNKDYIRQVCDKEPLLGDKTYQILVKKEYKNITELNDEKSIGEDKIRIINKYFLVGESHMLRPQMYLISLVVMVVLGVFVTIRINYKINEKRKINGFIQDIVNKIKPKRNDSV